MVYVVALREVFLYFFHDLRALADPLVLDLNVPAQGIEPGGYGPHMDVVKGFNPHYALDLADQFFEIYKIRLHHKV